MEENKARLEREVASLKARIVRKDRDAEAARQDHARLVARLHADIQVGNTCCLVVATVRRLAGLTHGFLPSDFAAWWQMKSRNEWQSRRSWARYVRCASALKQLCTVATLAVLTCHVVCAVQANAQIKGLREEIGEANQKQLVLEQRVRALKKKVDTQQGCPSEGYCVFTQCSEQAKEYKHRARRSGRRPKGKGNVASQDSDDSWSDSDDEPLDEMVLDGSDIQVDYATMKRMQELVRVGTTYGAVMLCWVLGWLLVSFG